MSKLCLIRIFSHPTGQPVLSWVFCGLLALLCPRLGAAQDDVDSPKYPLSVAVDGESLYTVDLDLPGVWKSGADGRQLYLRGSNLLKKPLNRPRAITLDPKGGIIVGDSPTFELYRIESAGADPQPLCDGKILNPMALVVSPDGSTLYVGDTQYRALFRLPIEGGDPELVARVNPRGLAFDADGKLWAVTPEAAALVRIDVETKQVETVIDGRPFQYPNGLAWAGDHGYVTDGYGKCIWRVTADGEFEKWHEGDPLVGPVGIAVTESSIFVADPKQKQVFEFDRNTKEIKERL